MSSIQYLAVWTSPQKLNTVLMKKGSEQPLRKVLSLNINTLSVLYLKYGCVVDMYIPDEKWTTRHCDSHEVSCIQPRIVFMKHPTQNLNSCLKVAHTFYVVSVIIGYSLVLLAPCCRWRSMCIILFCFGGFDCWHIYFNQPLDFAL